MPRTSLWLSALPIAIFASRIAGVLNCVAADLNTTPGTAGQLLTGFTPAFAFGASMFAVLFDCFLTHKNVFMAGLTMFVIANRGCARAPACSACCYSGSLLACPRSRCLSLRSRSLPKEPRGASRGPSCRW